MRIYHGTYHVIFQIVKYLVFPIMWWGLDPGKHLIAAVVESLTV